MQIHYRKGSENAQVDAMSRRKDYVKGNKPQAFQLLTQNADGTLQINRIAATVAMDANSVYNEMKAKQEQEGFLTQYGTTDQFSDIQAQPRCSNYLRKRITFRRCGMQSRNTYEVVPFAEGTSIIAMHHMDYYNRLKLPASADPVTKESYDSILVIVDRFTKFGRFIPFQEA
ncbi:hypothetical protein Q7P37_008243 [Cladosporium fusiforme]